MATKIIVTVGPKSEDPDKLLSIIKAGAEVIRLNFSHATFAQFRRLKKIIDKINRDHNLKITIIQDLQGPRIRVGQLPEAGRLLSHQQEVQFTYIKRPAANIGEIIPIDSPDLYQYIKKGDPLFLANGDIELKVTKVLKRVIFARVIIGGLLTSHRGINIPDTNFKKGGLTAKDIKDVKFAMKLGVDYIALSFVQTAQDILRLRRLLGKGSKIKIIAKIERALALKNIDAIIKASDAIMVARGDLGIEVPMEELPIIQKNLVRHAHWHDKPAIIATQVMTSMIDNSHPTRAEVSDIANAVLDGADFIMLSDETAIGNYASQAVSILNKVIKRTSSYLYKENVIKY